MSAGKQGPAQKITIRSYRPGDERQITVLFSEAFGKDLPMSYWTWRFRDNPAFETMASLAYEGDRLVSHYSVSPTLMSVFGKRYLTGLSLTTMTHPDYRGAGLFERLAESLYSQMKQKGMLMAWGFPNRLIHRSRVDHLSWLDIYELPTLFKSLSDYRPVQEPSSAVRILDGFDSRFDALWDKLKGNYRIITVRDSTYLDWRYKKNPVNEYTVFGYRKNEGLRGYAICKLFMGDVDLVDILYDNDSVGTELVSAAVKWAQQKQANRLNMWLNVHQPLHRLLEKYGFMNGEPITYLGARLLTPGSEKNGVYDFKNWYLTMGDSDVY